MQCPIKQQQDEHPSEVSFYFSGPGLVAPAGAHRTPSYPQGIHLSIQEATSIAENFVRAYMAVAML